MDSRPYSLKTSISSRSPEGSRAARSRSLIMTRVGGGLTSDEKNFRPGASGLTPRAMIASGLPVAAAASSCSTTAAAASLLRGWAAADAGPSIAIRRRARSTMKGSILDPLSGRRGRKHDLTSPGVRAVRDQAWDR